MGIFMPPSQLRVEIDKKKAENAFDRPGFRMTKQRKVVYDVLLDEKDHPTATEVFIRAKDRMDGISLATVYNCLETLNEAGLVKQIAVDRSPTRFCPNMHDHAHFFCNGCGDVYDINPADGQNEVSAWDLPAGAVIERLEVAMRGLCPKCAAKSETKSEA
ncbi:MAG: Fe2+ or Zn2+ uptake regulation protein [Verrucomicrobiales bacterium]